MTANRIGTHTSDDVVRAIESQREYFDSKFSDMDKLIRSMVPEGDLRAHNEYHAAAIKAKLKRAEFWDDMRKKLISQGLWAVAVFAGMAIFSALKDAFHK